jgi:hypothetical protein
MVRLRIEGSSWNLTVCAISAATTLTLSSPTLKLSRARWICVRAHEYTHLI